MKIISLNAYFGHIYEPLMDFITRDAPTTDVFCFQEMLSNPKEDLIGLSEHGRTNVLQEIARRLPNFSMHFAVMQDDIHIVPEYPKQLQTGVATFWKKSLPVNTQGDFFIYNALNTYVPKDYETLGHNAVWIQIGLKNPLTIVNLHGNSEPANKRDTPKRIEQSKKVLDFLAPLPGEKIVMGDFNLFPDTESIALFEKAGFRNLITEYNIKTTRGTFMRKLFPQYEHGPHGFQDFADYTFVTPNIKIQTFEVPDVPISDHLPMILECEVE